MRFYSGIRGSSQLGVNRPGFSSASFVRMELCLLSLDPPMDWSVAVCFDWWSRFVSLPDFRRGQSPGRGVGVSWCSSNRAGWRRAVRWWRRRAGRRR